MMMLTDQQAILSRGSEPPSELEDVMMSRRDVESDERSRWNDHGSLNFHHARLARV